MDLLSEKISPAVENSATPVKITANKIECPTPEKLSDSLPTNIHLGKSQLPETYKSTVELFDHMNCSLRLLHLRKRSTTFRNVSTQVEILAKRKFLYKHLAQIKYVLPEAVEIESVMMSDKETRFMKADLNISLVFDIVQGHSEISDFAALRQVFASRLMSFFAKNPEASDIPEAILPEPFNRSEKPVLKKLSTDSSAVTEAKPTSTETELCSEKVCSYPYVSRHFSRDHTVAETEKAKVLSSSLLLPSADNENGLQKQLPHVEQNITNCQLKESCSKPSSIESSINLNHLKHSIGSSVHDSPLVKLNSPANTLMIETPQPLPPRRLMPSSDAKHGTLDTQKSTSCNKPAKRVLEFSDLEGDRSAVDSTGHESTCYDIVNQDTKGTGITVEDRHLTSSTASQEVKRALGFSTEDCKETQTSSLTGVQISTRLADIATLIYGVLKSFNWSPVTKEELVHKIIMNSLDIIERKEVEEQFGLLERHVPDWIQSKLLSSGDIMYTINKVPNLDSVLSKLEHQIVSEQTV